MPTLDILRADTPGCQQAIHLNNAGAALPPKPVTRAMQAYLNEEALHGGYETAAKHTELLQRFYQEVAKLLGTQSPHIAWMNSASDAYVRALSSIPLQAGDTILTTVHDYLSNLIAFRQLVRHRGVKLEIAPDHVQGGVDMVAFQQKLEQLRPKLVAVTHMPTNSGLIQDVYTIGAWCQAYDCWYLVDACQTAGQLPLDVKKMQCDFLTATFRKYMRGPRGAGFLYVSERVLGDALEPRFMDINGASWTASDDYQARPDAKRFELWERNYALVRGATEAAAYAQWVGLDFIAQRTAELARQLRELLASQASIRLTDHGDKLGAIVGCYIDGQDPAQLLTQVRQAGIHASITQQPFAPLPMRQQALPWLLRLSPHYYNSKEEITKATKKIFKIIC